MRRATAPPPQPTNPSTSKRPVHRDLGGPGIGGPGTARIESQPDAEDNGGVVRQMLYVLRYEAAVSMWLICG